MTKSRILIVEDQVNTSQKSTTGDSFYGLIGKCEATLALTAQIAQVARFDSTVLIEGETGTGKEVVARAIHQASARAGKPLITVNCASLTPTLAGSELFGHKRGAFTDSVNDHDGLFAAAEGGTIFLDEIADFPLNLQPFLLRILEEREVTRVGETIARKINVRVLAASNRSLEVEVAARRFRSDLLYRIRVARIIVPPLRDRAETISLLAEAFLDQLARKYPHVARAVSDEALQLLRTYTWPGNVRELRNAVEYAAIRCIGEFIRPCDLPPEVMAGSHDHRPLSSDEERNRMLDALQQAHGNRSEAARVLGVSRATFYRRLTEFGLLPADN